MRPNNEAYSSVDTQCLNSGRADSMYAHKPSLDYQLRLKCVEVYFDKTRYACLQLKTNVWTAHAVSLVDPT